MKKLCAAAAVLLLIAASVFTAGAADDDLSGLYDMSGVYEGLSDEARRSLSNMGVESADPDEISEITFSSIMDEIASIASDNASSPLAGLTAITALLLLASLLTAYKGSLRASTSAALEITATLCVTSAAVLPAISVIKSTSEVIETSSNVMLAFLPVMVTVMAASGHAVSGASYYTMMLAAGEGVGQLASKVIVPLLDMFLGLSVTSSVSPSVNLGGLTETISKAVKWLLGFAMTVFTAVLAAKQLITSSVDDVSTRAVRFTLNSFIPIVGSALSDAYKTVQGSVTLLKSGMGVFVILSVAVVFLPVIIQSVLWVFTLKTGKAAADALSLPQPAKLLDAVAAVFSTLLAVLLCIMSVYIISTAIMLIVGRSG